MYYIQESDKPVLIAKIFNLIELVEDKIILPVCDKEKIDDKKVIILVKKVKKILEKTNCRTIILSKYLKKQENFVDLINMYKINVIDGRWLFLVLLDKILDYIIAKRKLEKKQINVSIMVKQNTCDYVIENIKKISRIYKSINIVTPNIEKFKKLEEEIFEENGVIITISNNKRKSLKRADIIINIDFSEEELNKYNIPDEAIIVNIDGNIEINKKRFNGLNINDYEISFEKFDEFDYEKDKLYWKKDLYEASVYKKQPYQYIERKINKDKVKIVELIGKRTFL